MSDKKLTVLVIIGILLVFVVAYWIGKDANKQHWTDGLNDQQIDQAIEQMQHDQYNQYDDMYYSDQYDDYYNTEGK